MTALAATEPAKTPGAMEHTKRTTLTDGTLVEFGEAPAGWLTKDKTVRKQDYRAYHVTAPHRMCEFCRGSGRVEGKTAKGRKCSICGGSGNASRRSQVPSVSTILDAILPKPGLPPWAEARGIEGTVEAVRRGLVPRLGEHEDYHLDLDASRAVETVRQKKLGADRARDDAADRGINVHKLLERYMLTGEPPNPAEHHGYIVALTRFLLDFKPDRRSAQVEQLVYSPTHGYAGRMDLRCRAADGLLYAIDGKTQERGCIYPGAHVQVNLYENAAIENGAEPADRCIVVVFAADGRYRIQLADHRSQLIATALDFYREIRPIDSLCESANRIEREARKAVPA